MATTTTPSESLSPIVSSRVSVYGLCDMLALTYGAAVATNFAMTLNTKYNFFPNEIPSGPRVAKFMHYGFGGRQNDSAQFGSAAPCSGLDGNLFSHMPVRAVPLAQDLSAAERVNYAGREVDVIDGVPYAIYHLTALTFTSTTVQMVRKDPVTGVSVPYTPDPANMSPVALTPNPDGTITDIADVISVVLPATITIKGSDVIEVVNALYRGDMHYAMISEYGLVAASPQTVNATDAHNQTFSFTEAIHAEQFSHYTWGGMQFTSEDDVYVKNIELTLANFAIKK